MSHFTVAVITEDIVKQFITQLTTQWDNLVVEYRYDADEDVWDIWHFNYGLQYNDMNFQKAVGKLIRTLFFDQGIFNISFGYKQEGKRGERRMTCKIL